MKAGLTFISKVLTALAKSVLLPLGLTAAGHAPDVGGNKKNIYFGAAILIMSNKGMEDTTK